MITCGYPGHAHDSLGECDSWRCDCGNQAHLDGFLTCDTDGEFYEPATGDDMFYLLCGGCGTIYTPDGQETGRAVPLHEEGPSTTCWDCGVTVAVGDVYVSQEHKGKALCPECFARAEAVGRARLGGAGPAG